MQYAIDLHRRDSCALERRQKYTAERIAQRGAKAAFQRFGYDCCYLAAFLARLNFNLAWSRLNSRSSCMI